MNEVLTTILQVCSAAASIIAIVASLLYIHRTKNEIKDMAESYIERAKAFYVAEKTDFAQSIPELAKNMFSPFLSAKMGELGQMSGLSRGMKAMETEVITDLANQAVPGFGRMAAKYIQKYPFLLPIIQQFSGGMGKAQQPQNGGQKALVDMNDPFR